MKTSELTGMALCYAVTMIEMPGLVWGETVGIHHASNQIVVPNLPEPDCYSPFTTWKMFGPIIERERIGIWSSESGDHDGEWCARMIDTYITYSPTPLIAAMRCYIASRLGEEVEIPEELI